MEEKQKLPVSGRIVVRQVDGKPHISLEWVYDEEETPPTVERQRDSEVTSG